MTKCENNMDVKVHKKTTGWLFQLELDDSIFHQKVKQLQLRNINTHYICMQCINVSLANCLIYS